FFFSSRRRHTRFSRDWSSDVCSSDLARDRHAVLALFLDLPCEDVDVNVHPAKTEVRFRDAQGVRGFIVSGLRQALATGDRRSARSEERRVGKECRLGWSRYVYSKNIN